MGLQQAQHHNRNAEVSRVGTGTAELPRLPFRRSVRAPEFLGSNLFQLTIPGIAAAFLAITIVFAALGRDLIPEGTVPPGVHVAGTFVGEMDKETAKGELERHFSDFTQRPVTLTFQDKTWEPTMAELGAEFDFDQSLDRATYSQAPISRVGTRIFGPDDRDFPLRIWLDDARLSAYVASIAEVVNKEPRVPELALENGSLTVTDAEVGIEIDQQTIADSIRDTLFSLEHRTISLRYDEVAPAFDDTDVEAVRGLIHEALGESMVIWFEDRRWTIEPSELAEYLTLQPAEDGTIELGFDHDPLFWFLDSLIGDINRPPRNAQVAWGGQGVVATSPSQNGIERDLHAMLVRLEEAIATGQREVELTYNIVRPAIDSNNLGALGIETLMSQGQSAFWNSAPSRAHNISVAAGYLDGTLIPPGHEFSFNQAVGQITAERGYQEGYVIQAERTVEGVGGGVCQVSTTVFRAAFFSGLPITERHPHAYIVGFYEQGNWPLGFDAAIFQPGVDFRFVNTTDSYILMHTHVADQQLYVNLYGADLGYTVEMGDPVVSSRTDPPADVEVVDESLAPGERRQVEEAKPGLEVTLPRTVTNRNGEVVRQDYFYSNFQAWGNRFLVGPSTSPTAQSPDQAPTAQAPSGEIIEGAESSGSDEP